MLHKMITVAGLVFVVAAFALTPVEVTGADAAEFKKGDIVFVVADGTEFKLGNAVQEKLRIGTPLKIVEIQGDWIGGDIQVNGKTIQGWVRVESLSRVSPERAPAPVPPKAEPEKTGDSQKPAELSAARKKKLKDTLAAKFKQMMAEKERVAQKGTPPVNEVAPKKSTPKSNVPNQGNPVVKAGASKQKTAEASDVKTKVTKSNETETAKPKPAKESPTAVMAKPDKPVLTQPKAVPDAKTLHKPMVTSDKAPTVKATSTKIPSPSTKNKEKEKEKTAGGETPAKNVSKKVGGATPGEGPEALAEKFAKMLAAQRERTKKEELPEKRDNEKKASQPAPSLIPTAKSKPAAAPPALPPAQKPTISVLVLRLADDLAEVKPSERIGQLVITGGEFSNRSLRGLKGLTVSSLSIEAINVSNIGLQYIGQMHGIRKLRLWSPGFDDDALTLLKNLTDLELLDIEGTAISGVGFDNLKDMQKLEMLVLGPKVSDATIAGLESLSALQYLDLRACPKLTLACVESIAKLKHLKVVWLPRNLRTKVKRALRETLPGCQVRS